MNGHQADRLAQARIGARLADQLMTEDVERSVLNRHCSEQLVGAEIYRSPRIVVPYSNCRRCVSGPMETRAFVRLAAG
jgi:hypothetical protein